MTKSVGSLKPAKCISVDSAKELHNNWRASRGIDIEKSLGFEDAREFLFSVEELQQFLDYVKSASLAEGINNPGIRVYLGSYDNNLNNKATVFFSATNGVDSGAQNNYNVDPLNKGISGHPPTKY